MQKDITKKRLISKNDVFADIFNALLFEGEEILLEEYLVPLPTESFTRRADGQIRQGNRDVRKADIRNGSYCLIFGEEDQEGIDNTMPQRIMGYDFSSYEEQIKTHISKNTQSKNPAITKRIHDEQKLTPVITLVLYWGTEEWKSPQCLYDMIEFPPEIEKRIRPYVADYPMNLIQMASLPKSARERFKSDFRLLAEYAALKNKPEKLKKMLEEDTQVICHREEFLDALCAVSGDKRYGNMKAQIEERAKKEAITMCVVLDEYENRGIEIGLARGVEQGIEQGIERGIEAFVLDNLEEGKARTQILNKLVRRFYLSEERAEFYLNKYIPVI